MVMFRAMDIDITRAYKLLHNMSATLFIAIEEVTVNVTKTPCIFAHLRIEQTISIAPKAAHASE